MQRPPFPSGRRASHSIGSGVCCVFTRNAEQLRGQFFASLSSVYFSPARNPMIRVRIAFHGCRRWQVTCNKKGMKKPKNAGIRTYGAVSSKEEGLGPGSAGQSGDTQGLANVAEAGPESVEELVEEGQYFEAEAISGVEDAPDADVAEVHTKQVPEDDVPPEELNQD